MKPDYSKNSIDNDPASVYKDTYLGIPFNNSAISKKNFAFGTK